MTTIISIIVIVIISNILILRWFSIKPVIIYKAPVSINDWIHGGEEEVWTAEAIAPVPVETIRVSWHCKATRTRTPRELERPGLRQICDKALKYDANYGLSKRRNREKDAIRSEQRRIKEMMRA